MKKSLNLLFVLMFSAALFAGCKKQEVMNTSEQPVTPAVTEETTGTATEAISDSSSENETGSMETESEQESAE